MGLTLRRILLTTELLEAARVRADALPIFQNSHRKEQANLVGCIGEIVFDADFSHLRQFRVIL
ncbi:hypothetical protein NBRC3280_3404 [Acetobacter pasteurianus NBRC 3280]|uniref:Uncharacterized protein n=1 Tax=Acetobacter pasteurianus NBRC 3278 TaxID=1226660 RepID=A0A401X9D9_ACEPA|nr:hypothetical protein NBRC3277_3407 [Acetobacter pasteurianus NBRC 3277]GCD64436.1 hypothetical protein NBRC3278_3529 [Acetobacter pasteurianus NBRC 3278]GCD70769.1 hypothetical protein NBRC3280_3404 [Acetobacter pasteurianus NBRC 3280]